MSRKQNRATTRQWLIDYKKNHPCEICEETHIAVLDFHHVDRSERRETISAMINRDATLKEIKLEASKCIMLCCNCHRKLHYEEDHS